MKRLPPERSRMGRIERRALDRRVFALALPALGALIAEPLFLLVDTALVGHLGTVPLAALGIAGAILNTAVGLMVFLAYSTTPLVARRRGAGNSRGAAQAGIDGLWLACAIGVALSCALWLATPWLVGRFTSDLAILEQATTYARVSCFGLPPMLMIFGATGLLRGFQNTTVPLAVAGVGFTINALLNWLFMYGFGWGIGGSAWGTVCAQWAMLGAYVVVVARLRRAHGAVWWPQRSGLAAAGRSGGWLLLRTVGLRTAILTTVAVAASFGPETTAAYQIVFILFSCVSFALDALAIAAQALVGDALGAGVSGRADAVRRRVQWWGTWGGVAAGLLLVCLSPVLGYVFTSDAETLALLPLALVVLGVSLPLGGYVFVCDGVLMGAGDVRYLAWASVATVLVYVPVLWCITLVPVSGALPVALLTASFAVLYMLLRALTLGWRLRGSAWVVTGADRGAAAPQPAK